MRKTTTLWLCLPLLVLISSQPAQACSCAPLPEPQQAAEGADAVFSGTVLEVTSSGGLQNQVTIRVDEVWKGAKCGEVTITTPLDSAACGYAFQPDTSYLIYATKEKGKLSTNLCTRTRLLSEAGDDRTALGPPKEDCGAK